MSNFLSFFSISLPFASVCPLSSPGVNNISPESDGIEGRKKGAFSGFLGGSIGLLRTCNYNAMMGSIFAET